MASPLFELAQLMLPYRMAKRNMILMRGLHRLSTPSHAAWMTQAGVRHYIPAYLTRASSFCCGFFDIWSCPLLRLFFSYSHADEALRDQLQKQLEMLKRQGIIETWHDRRITAGEVIDHAISEQLETADIIPVSYTHLDVYKRQASGRSEHGCPSRKPAISRTSMRLTP